MYYVYVLISENSEKDNKFYIGITNNIQRRLQEHKSGQQKSTKARRPFRLLLEERYDDRVSARAREKYLKSGIGREFLKNKFCSLYDVPR